jgi:hypothetical protein
MTIRTSLCPPNDHDLAAKNHQKNAHFSKPPSKKPRKSKEKAPAKAGTFLMPNSENSKR